MTEQWNDPRPPITPHGTHTADPASFVHTDETCECEPWLLKLGDDVEGQRIIMHRPVTGRGDITRKPLIKGGKERKS